MLKVDLHLHTGDDPVDTIPHTARDLIDRAARLGFDALAITLHDHQVSDPRTFAYAGACGITLIPGCEATIEGRHVLLLNFPAAAVSAVHTFEDLRRLRARGDGLVIAPHPFFPSGSCMRRLLDRHADLFDAVEWSYFWTRAVNFNARGDAWARERGKSIVGNSDLHDLRQLGRTYSLVDAVAGAPADEICAAIREGRVRVVTEPVPAPELAQVFGGMLLRPRKSAFQRSEAAVRPSTHAGPPLRASDPPQTASF